MNDRERNSSPLADEKFVGSNPTPRTNDKPRISRFRILFFWMKREGYREATLKRYSKIIRTLTRTVNLLDAEAVKFEIANKNWSEGTKELACDAYSSCQV